MITKKSGIEKNLAAIGVMVIVAVLLLYYFMVFVPQNERALKGQGLRTMHTIALNCAEKYQHYPKALQSAPAEHTAKWLKVNFPLLEFKCDGKKLVVERVYKHDSLYQDINGISKYGDPLLKPNGEIESTDIASFILRGHDFLFGIENKPDDRRVDVKCTMARAKSLYPMEKLKLLERTSFPFTVSIPEFMVNLKHYDFFDDIFLLGPEKISRKGVSADNCRIVLDESRLGLVQYGVPSKLVSKGMSIYADTLSGEPFLVFHQRIKIDNQLELSLVGLISKAAFDARARQVPNWLLIFVIFGLLLLVQVWPILKLFLISEEERLRSIDVQFATFSVVFCAGFVTVLMGGWFTFFGPQKCAIKDTLARVSDAMATQFQNEIYERRDFINYMLPDRVKPQVLTKRNFSFSFNELFAANVDRGYGNVFIMYVEANRNYPSLNCKNSYINVTTRPYFQVPADALKDGVRMDVFVQSLISRSSGALECAVSVQSTTGPKMVKVMTSFLPSVMSPILPAGYSFAIIDKNGDVQFHSDVTKVKSENLFDECDNDNALRSYVKHGAKDYLGLRYGGKDYETYCRPLFNDWYLVLFYNWETTRTFAASVFVLCLTSLLLLLLFIVMLHMLFRLDKPSFKVLQFRIFFFGWLNPLTIPPDKLRFLTFALVGMMVFHVLWIVVGRSVVGTFLWCFISTSLCYGLVYRLLRKPDRAITYFEMALFAVIATSMALFIINGLQQEDTVWPLLVLALMLFTFVILYLVAACILNTQRSTKQTVRPGKGYRPYRLFLMLCVLNLTVLPAVKFFRDHLVHEDIIRTRAGLRAEIMQRQVRSLKNAKDVYSRRLASDFTKPGTIAINEDSVGPPYAYFGTVDNYLYSQAETYFGDDQEMHQGLMLEDPALLDSVTFSHHGDDVVIASAPTSLLTGSESLRTYAKNLYPRYLPSQKNIFVWVLFVSVALLVMLWKALFRILNKIFYLPLRYMPGHTTSKGEGHLDAYPPMPASTRLTGFYSEEHFAKQLQEGVIKASVESYDVRSAITEARYENRIIALQNENEAVFREIWSACTSDEKHFLYDLAEDGIVNQGDRKILKRLVDKGLVYDVPKLQIVSAPLTNFVLGAMSPDELFAMTQAARKEGRWSNWRFPLIILIFATLGFLSFVQEDFMTRVSALVASITVILPNLISLGSNFGKLIPHKKTTP